MLLNSCIFKRLSQRVAQPNAVHVGDEVLRSNLGDSPFLYVKGCPEYAAAQLISIWVTGLSVA